MIKSGILPDVQQREGRGGVLIVNGRGGVNKIRPMARKVNLLFLIPTRTYIKPHVCTFDIQISAG